MKFGFLLVCLTWYVIPYMVEEVLRASQHYDIQLPTIRYLEH